MFARSSTESSKNSALQRAEIAEIYVPIERAIAQDDRTVLFNEPKLLKSTRPSLPALPVSQILIPARRRS